jgi:hypothetical protein
VSLQVVAQSKEKSRGMNPASAFLTCFRGHALATHSQSSYRLVQPWIFFWRWISPKSPQKTREGFVAMTRCRWAMGGIGGPTACPYMPYHLSLCAVRAGVSSPDTYLAVLVPK